MNLQILLKTSNLSCKDSGIGVQVDVFKVYIATKTSWILKPFFKSNVLLPFDCFVLSIVPLSFIL